MISKVCCWVGWGKEKARRWLSRPCCGDVARAAQGQTGLPFRDADIIDSQATKACVPQFQARNDMASKSNSPGGLSTGEDGFTVGVEDDCPKLMECLHHRCCEVFAVTCTGASRSLCDDSGAQGKVGTDGLVREALDDLDALGAVISRSRQSGRERGDYFGPGCDLEDFIARVVDLQRRSAVLFN